MIKRPKPPDISQRGQVFYMALGLVPLLMLLQFWTRSGTGLNPPLWGFMALLAASFLVTVNYFMFYREHKPRAALIPPGPMRALLVAAILIPLGVYNMLATSSDLSLTLSPGPKFEASKTIPVIARVVLQQPIKAPRRPQLNLKKESWLLKFPYENGALWGALGYSVAFALAGALFGLLRRELQDPRDEHAGTGALGALVRGAVGLFYGAAMGFGLGASLISILRTLFPTITMATPRTIVHWIYVFGAASNPNVAFTYAFSTACLMAGAMSVFLGRRDFTASVSDPKAPELTRPVQVLIPAIPPPPQMFHDPGQLAAESQQILKQFGAELHKVFGAPDWNYERYDVPVIGRVGQKGEPEATNLISSRTPDEGDYDNAMGSLSNVYVQITAELGKLEISAYDWLCLAEGAMLELPKSPDGTIAIGLNGQSAGRGRALTVNGNKAVKVTSLRAPVERLVASSG